MARRFLLRSCAVLAAVVLAAAPAFAQIKPDTPLGSSPPPSGSAPSGADLAAIRNIILPVMDATNQMVATVSSPVDQATSAHAIVLNALAAANASPGLTHCVTSYYAAENAALAAKVRQQFAKILGELKKQRAATLAAMVKMLEQTQQRETGGGSANPQTLSQDVAATFDQMEQSVEVAQAKLLASLR